MVEGHIVLTLYCGYLFGVLKSVSGPYSMYHFNMKLMWLVCLKTVVVSCTRKVTLAGSDFKFSTFL